MTLRNGAVYTLYRIETLETLNRTHRVRRPAKWRFRAELRAGSPARGGAPTLREGSEYILFLWTGRSGMTQITACRRDCFRSSLVRRAGSRQ